MTGRPLPRAPNPGATATGTGSLSPVAIEAALADLSAEVTQDAVERLRRAERLRLAAAAAPIPTR